MIQTNNSETIGYNKLAYKYENYNRMLVIFIADSLKLDFVKYIRFNIVLCKKLMIYLLQIGPRYRAD